MKKSLVVFRYFLAVLGLIFFAFLASPVQAVTKESGSLRVTYTDPLFGTSIIWYPSLSETRSLQVENIGSDTHKTYIRGDNGSDTGNLSTVMFFKVSEGGTALYGASDSKTMGNFWGDGEVGLSNVSAGASSNYDIAITFWREAGNEFQNKKASFDLVIGFEGTEDVVVVSIDTGGDGDGDGGGDGGVVAGISTTPTPPGVVRPRVGGAVTETKGAVAGAQVGEVTEEGMVSGITCEDADYLWWLPLVVQGVVTSLFFWLIWKREEFNLWWLFPVLLAGLSQLVHEILGCNCATSELCPWYWGFNVIILVITSGFYYLKHR